MNPRGKCSSQYYLLHKYFLHHSMKYEHSRYILGYEILISALVLNYDINRAGDACDKNDSPWELSLWSIQPSWRLVFKMWYSDQRYYVAIY